MIEKEQIVDVFFSDNKTVFPYQTVTLTTKDEPSNEYVGILFKKQRSTPSINQDKDGKNLLEEYEEVGTLVKVIGTQKKLFMNGEKYSSSSRFTGLGKYRFEVVDFVNGEIKEAVVKIKEDEMSPEEEAMMQKEGKIKKLKDLAYRSIRMKSSNRRNKQSQKNFIFNEDNIIRLTYIVAIQLQMDHEKCVQFIKIDNVARRVDFLISHMDKEMSKLNLADGDVTFDVSNPSDLAKIEYTVEKMDIPKVAKRAMMSEIKKLKKSSPGKSGYSVGQNYLELMLSLPWNKSTEDKTDLDNARMILDEDHSGLDKIKQRIIEFLAVRSLNKKARGSILCFYGPPGVGKTSLGKSIARSLNRKYERIALGGVSDESLLRGHRRTYVGAYCGVIIQALRRAGTNNPVILLDEIDKIGTRNFHGDPSSALLEILDPAQNSKFTDHYLNVPFDLSKCLFIATANRLDTIQSPLLDRMEILTIPGYTSLEKVEIAEKYLVKKSLEENGLPMDSVVLKTPIITKIIKDYTREAGVRELERKISSVCRSVAVQYLGFTKDENQKVFDSVEITKEGLSKILGPPKHKDFMSYKLNQPGTAFGLAWTEAGGKVLIVETSLSKGRGTINLTGQLGDVMKESVTTAFSWIKSNRSKLMIESDKILEDIGVKDTKDKDLMELIDIHVHFPSAAIPKDGPSAGVTICTALVSLFTRRMVRDDIAMTGEISLTGNVLPVGGIREKVLAASSAGLKRVILPEINSSDFGEIENIDSMELKPVFAKNIWTVLSTAIKGSVAKKDYLKPDFMTRSHKL